MQAIFSDCRNRGPSLKFLNAARHVLTGLPQFDMHEGEW